VVEHDLAWIPGRFGQPNGAPGLRVHELTDVALASLVARRGQTTAAASAAARSFGCTLPNRPQAESGPDIAFLWAGPAQWLAVAESATTEFESRLAGPFAGVAAVFDQSDSRVMLELEGPRVRDVLAKGVSIDLGPRAFTAGHVAATLVAHLHVQLWQVDDAPRYRILVVRTYFGSFWRWLASSAAEYGGEVLEPRRYVHHPPAGGERRIGG
jgi:heterotetrameric sarcosine oxidase gamma subunit